MEMDSVSSYLDNFVEYDPQSEIKLSELYESYQEYCTETKRYTHPLRSFAAKLSEKRLERRRRKDGVYLIGVRIRDED